MRVAFSATAIFLILTSCGLHTVSREDLLRQSEIYASRISFGWRNLSCFQLRGNARLQGSNLIARGPFVLWGRVQDSLLRGDFYGPDGRPVASVRGDTSGILIYLPQDEYASFMPGGLQVGSGTIRTVDLIYLLRTGFPICLESWMICNGSRIEDGSIHWSFLIPDSQKHMCLSMDSGDLFPYGCFWDSGEFEITASSPHDEYKAWPWGWIIDINGDLVSLELTEINSDAVPWEGIWEMIVPIPIDTLHSTPFWQPSWEILER